MTVCVWLLQSAQHFPGSSMVWMSVLHSFYGWKVFHYIDRPHFCLSIRLLWTFGLCPTFGMLWIMLLWMWCGCTGIWVLAYTWGWNWWAMRTSFFKHEFDKLSLAESRQLWIFSQVFKPDKPDRWSNFKLELPNRTFCNNGDVLYLFCSTWWPSATSVLNDWETASLYLTSINCKLNRSCSV